MRMSKREKEEGGKGIERERERNRARRVMREIASGLERTNEGLSIAIWNFSRGIFTEAFIGYPYFSSIPVDYTRSIRANERSMCVCVWVRSFNKTLANCEFHCARAPELHSRNHYRALLFGSERARFDVRNEIIAAARCKKPVADLGNKGTHSSRGILSRVFSRWDEKRRGRQGVAGADLSDTSICFEYLYRLHPRPTFFHTTADRRLGNLTHSTTRFYTRVSNLQRE